MKPVHLGLVGYPLEHSLSPRIHSAAFATANLSGDYRLFPVPPTSPEAEVKALTALIQKIRTGRLLGLNVTIPHKQTVISLLDEITEEAKQIGAVNTILRSENKVVGGNTDAQGFINDLMRLGFHRPPQENNNALVLGAGGAARAVTYALAKLGWKIHLAARRMEQAVPLIESIHQYGGKLEAVSLSPETFHRDFRLIVNTTPLGMLPYQNASPWPIDIPFPKNAVVYDLVYQNPTSLLRSAEAANLRSANGLGMLIEQAALSFKIWTGVEVSREKLWLAVRSTTLQGDQ